METNNQIRALKAIDAIVEAYRKGTLVITSEKHGYTENAIGLDVVMAMIKNHVIDGLHDPLELKEGYLYD